MYSASTKNSTWDQRSLEATFTQAPNILAKEENELHEK